MRFSLACALIMVLAVGCTTSAVPASSERPTASPATSASAPAASPPAPSASPTAGAPSPSAAATSPNTTPLPVRTPESPAATPGPAATALPRPSPVGLFVTITISQNGDFKASTLPAARCDVTAQIPGQALRQSDTLTADGDGNVFWRYTPFVTAPTIGSHAITCAAGGGSVQDTRPFPAP